ncbi:hypothetical protein C8Q80DRAFT_1268670 [Daedaleopsis nitida]|nr:hypothetical protein C8Q80DRAFT_1268670 [Daedaleopsis nitida]
MAPFVDTPSRKNKKPKGKNAEPGATVDDAGPGEYKKEANELSPIDTNDADQLETHVKEKKRKKRKHEQQVDVPEVVEELGEPQKKKKRKHPAEEGGEGGEDAARAMDNEAIEGGSEGKKKRKKRKESKAAEERSREEEMEETQRKAYRAAEAVEDGVDLPAHSDDAHKKSKKGKKKRQKEGTEEEEQDASLSKVAGVKPEKKKRKHRSPSKLPDPSGDEVLSEQAQRALQYAFSQCDDPSGWKFNKARQNWLIRNVWSEESIPEKYMSLVSLYLQGVQGGVRETLIKSCRDAMELPKATANRLETAPVEGSTEASDKSRDTAANDSPAKRTVRFSVEEPSTTTVSSDEVKKQRAQALLSTLTSNTS